MLRCITKSTLRQLNEAAGKLDSDTGMVVVGFVGRLEMADGLYHGQIHYTEVGDEPPKESVSVRAIVPTKMVADHGVLVDPVRHEIAESNDDEIEQEQ
jgi:hypothetical protein